MANLVPVSRGTHGDKVWRRLQTYSFAARQHYVPIGGLEFGRVVPVMPIAFMEISGQLQPIAVLSLEPGSNVFVASDGRWLAPYLPILFATYPFRLLRQEGTDKFSLWVDSDADHLGDAAHSTELYYDQEGQLAPRTKAVFDLLATFEQNRIHTAAAVATLAEAGVLRPWELKVKDGGAETIVRGMQRVDEVALGNLEDSAFLRLRKSHAIPIAYAQLLSMQQLAVFSQLKQLRSRIAGLPVAPKEAATSPQTGDAFTMVDPDILRFD
jgi:hypothetical protein